MAEFKNNFRGKYEDIQCKLCKSNIDDQHHIFYCEILIDNCKELAENVKVEYEDIFLTKSKQRKSIKLISKIWKVRQKLIEEYD